MHGFPYTAAQFSVKVTFKAEFNMNSAHRDETHDEDGHERKSSSIFHFGLKAATGRDIHGSPMCHGPVFVKATFRAKINMN